MYKDNLHIRNGAKARFKIHPIAATLLFLALLLCSELADETLLGFADALLKGWVSPLGTTAAMTLRNLIIPFATPLVLLFVWVAFAEGRKLSTLGFPRLKPLGSYLKGFALGVTFISLYWLITLCLGAYSTGNIHLNSHTSNLFLSSFIVLIGWLLQGASEEILTRGWFLQVSAQKRILTGIFLSSSIFALLHLGNPGMEALSLINLVLYGLFSCSYVLYSENLWGICGFHSAWNWAQGNLFGIAVSGNTTIGTSLLVMGPPQGSTLISGGSFGAEGSLIVTGILCLGTLGFLYLSYKKGQFRSDPSSFIQLKKPPCK